MLFKRRILDGIGRGEITLAFRRWKRPTVVSGGRLRTSAGEVRFGEVRAIAEAALTEDDARRAGFASLTVLKQDLRDGQDRQLFRIEILGLDEDARVALRADGEIEADAAAGLVARLARWDRISGTTGYHVRLLDVIAAKPCRSGRAHCRFTGHREAEAEARHAQAEGTRPDRKPGRRLQVVA